MPNFHIRVSRSYSEIKPWIDNEPCSSVIVYEHPADGKVARVHCHIWAKGIGKSDTLKNHLKKVIGSVEKTDWYFTEKSKDKTEWDDNLITYMSKGVLTPQLVRGYTDEYVEEYKLKWVKPDSPVKTIDGKLYVEKEIKESKKKTKRELIEEMKNLYLESMEIEEVIKLIRKVLIKHNEVIGMYKVMDYYDSLLMYANKHKFVDMVVQKINSRVRV